MRSKLNITPSMRINWHKLMKKLKDRDKEQMIFSIEFRSSKKNLRITGKNFKKCRMSSSAKAQL